MNAIVHINTISILKKIYDYTEQCNSNLPFLAFNYCPSTTIHENKRVQHSKKRCFNTSLEEYSSKRNSLISNLENLCRLKKDWDGHGAEPLSVHVIKNSIYFIRILPIDFPMPRLDYSADNEIILTWKKGGVKANIKIEESGTMRCHRRKRKDNGEIEDIQNKKHIDDFLKTKLAIETMNIFLG